MSNHLIRNLLWGTSPLFGLREAVDVKTPSLRGWVAGMVIRQDGWAYQIISGDHPPVWLPESDLQKIPLIMEESQGFDDEF
ncbi:hypothetical protein [Coleofasciculus sp. FACHB-1120]|uniref:hypothetical protein n=1 Tax=Coleofasciculus sp. FACHB-1120 TaxID=2692783 RepID=UPI00168A2984|nr:hypothetical protein [Coleofasciculus sp. FACHB-1120]MBD2743682.1 hypothetical protein [Coleofasciculus sp. FACHB-1120]